MTQIVENNTDTKNHSFDVIKYTLVSVNHFSCCVEYILATET